MHGILAATTEGAGSHGGTHYPPVTDDCTQRCSWAEPAGRQAWSRYAC